MRVGGDAGRSPRRSSQYSARPCYDVRGMCVHVTLPRRGRCQPQFRVQVTQMGAARETGSEQEVIGEKNSRHAHVHGVCVCACVCVHGVRVHGVCVHVWCVCSWCAHVCGCVCVQRERHPVTLANTAHTWARAVMSHPGHRMWSVVTRLRPRGLCGRVCGEAVSTGPSEVTWLVAVGKQKSLDPQEKGARVHCIVASPVL